LVMSINNRKGFTLIELLIVVAIIGILAAIAIPNFLEAQTRSKVARAVSEMRNLSVALEAYRIDHNSYPCPTASDGQTFADAGTAGEKMVGVDVRTGTVGDMGQNLTTPIAFIVSIPLDPFRKELPDTYYLRTGRGRYRYGTNFLQCWIMSSFGPDQNLELTRPHIRHWARTAPALRIAILPSCSSSTDS
jgi:prepilin-type N-terminal cleavage/methylation domain-containing protein